MNAPAKAARISVASVNGLIVDAMMKSGVPANDAAKIAELMVEADLIAPTPMACSGCRMSGHAGAAGVYAALPLKANMIGIYSAVANANHMPLAGGAEPLLGTNPL